MSYILDALRRADHERQRHGPRTPILAPGPATPTATLRPNRKNRATKIAATVAGVLVLSAASVWLWTGQDRSPAGDAMSDGAKATAPSGDRPGITTATVSGGPVVPPPEPAMTTPIAVPPPPPPPPDNPALSNSAGEAIAAVALPAPVRQPPPAEATLGSPTRPASSSARAGTRHPDPGDLPTAWRDLPLSQRKNLPHPTLAVHVYDPDPQRRFVMIELQKYREGDSLPDGSELERIHADGLILVYRGQRYSLPRR